MISECSNILIDFQVACGASYIYSRLELINLSVISSNLDKHIDDKNINQQVNKIASIYENRYNSLQNCDDLNACENSETVPRL